MKRAVTKGAYPQASPQDELLAREHAQALLVRSINFGHDRLAVLRLVMAARVGAEISPSCWEYCKRVNDLLRDPSVKKHFDDAVRLASPALIGPRSDESH